MEFTEEKSVLRFTRADVGIGPYGRTTRANKVRPCGRGTRAKKVRPYGKGNAPASFGAVRPQQRNTFFRRIHSDETISLFS